ncbi:MAG: hypothetical protein JXM71_10940, partial [Spirochaetales bacterium]|nr:hypothetical protein [Spirochaetales bacterium]
NEIRASFFNQNAPVGAGTEQVYLGGRVYADAGLTPLAGATVRVLVDGTASGSAASSDVNGYWGVGVPSTALSAAGQRIAAYIDAASPNGGATISVWGGSNLYNLDIYRGSVLVRHDNGGNPSVADIDAARGATGGNFPVTASTATTATFAAYSLYVPNGVTFVPGGGTTLSVGAVAGPGSYTAGTGALSVAGNFAPGSFDAGTGTVTFTGNGSTAAYSFYNLTLDGVTRTSTGAWTVSNSLTLMSGTWNPGAFTHTVAGNWNSSGITFAPTTGTIRLTGTGNIASATNFWNLSIAGATRTLTASPSVLGNLHIEGGAILAASGTEVLSVAGNWTNEAGTSGFAAASGEVSFINAAKTSVISGNTTFFDFSCDTATGKILAFAANSTTEVAGSFNVDLNASLIRSGGSGSDQWNLDVSGTNDSEANAFSVADSNAVTALTVNSALDLGNNSGWTFSASYPTWDGSAGDSLWSTAANWSNTTVPETLVTVLIPSDTSTFPIIDGA